MAASDFTTTVVVEQTPKQVFNAITTPQAWWSGEITGSTGKLNDEFTYRYKDLHMSKNLLRERSGSGPLHRNTGYLSKSTR
jgi:hypothetical protein